MSFYRFVRFTALLTLARRYRRRLVRIVFTASFALVTAWQYADVAAFLDTHHPEWAAPALIIKTLVVYGALLLVFWDLGRMLHGDDGETRASAAPPTERTAGRKRASATLVAETTPATSRLDRLAEKPKLRQRRDDILTEPDSTKR